MKKNIESSIRYSKNKYSSFVKWNNFAFKKTVEKK
jgi:hypothetical protein